MKTKYCIALIGVLFFSCTSTKQISEEERTYLINELNSINKIDQEFAGIPPQNLIDEVGFDKAWEVFMQKRDSVNLMNQSKIKELYKEYGYLGINEVGEEASQDFWISIQHADNDVDFQRQMLHEMKKEIAKNNVKKSNYALLEDRVNINSNQKQRFGSQVEYNKIGQAIPKIGLIDSANIDQLRKDYELEDYKSYLNDMTTMHFEMNKAEFSSIGINEPQLY